MHAATMMTAGAGDVGNGALSVVQVHCSSDTKQSAYKVAAAEKAKPRRTVGDEKDGQRGMVHSVIGRKRKRPGGKETEGARESQRYQRVSIVYTELIKTSPFNTPSLF